MQYFIISYSSEVIPIKFAEFTHLYLPIFINDLISHYEYWYNLIAMSDTTPG